MKTRLFCKLFLLILALLFLLQGCSSEIVTVWCLTECVQISQTGAKESVHITQIRYDAKGNPLEALSGPKDELTVVERNTYDSQGNLIAFEIIPAYFYHKDTYDANGNLLKRETGENTFQYTYDDANLLLTLETMDQNGKQVSLTHHVYDENGQLTQQIIERDGIAHSEYRYTYDTQGNILSKIYYENGKLSPNNPSTRWTYDDNGNLTQIQNYLGAELQGPTHSYTYDDNGNQLSYFVIRQANSTYSKNFYTYDTEGKKTSHTVLFRSIGQFEKKRHTTYRYDEQNNLIEQRTIEPDGNEYRILRTYDKNSNLLTEHSYGATAYPYFDTWTYDEDGRPLTYVQEQDGNILCQKTWTYDRHGNLIQEERIQQGEKYICSYSYTPINIPSDRAQILRDEQADIREGIKSAGSILH